MTGQGTTGEPPLVRLPRTLRLWLAARICVDFVGIWLRLRRRRLPDLVRELARPGAAGRSVDPRRLGHLVYRVMNIGPLHPRCLIMALVLFRALHRQGTAADLVLGLPSRATNHHAHAWVEVDGKDVGPPPGRHGHAELARYGGVGPVPG